MVKVNVISGFLGAGKTTLIRKLLTGRLRNEKVVLLENEYGEIGIDGGFMKDAGIQITELFHNLSASLLRQLPFRRLVLGGILLHQLHGVGFRANSLAIRCNAAGRK